MQVVLSSKYIHSFTIVKIIQLINVICTTRSLIEYCTVSLREQVFFLWHWGQFWSILNSSVKDSSQQQW